MAEDVLRDQKLYPGDSVRATISITDADDEAVDPATQTVKVKDPAGTVTSYVYGTDAEVVRTGTGAYRIHVTCSTAGRWYLRSESTNPASADEVTWVVKDTQF